MPDDNAKKVNYTLTTPYLGKSPIPLPNNGDTGEGPIAQGMTAFEARTADNLASLANRASQGIGGVADVAQAILNHGPQVTVDPSMTKPINIGTSAADTLFPRIAGKSKATHGVVLENLRTKYPAYRNVDDGKLLAALLHNHPSYVKHVGDAGLRLALESGHKPNGKPTQ
jgi:hypothetical protein